MAALELEAQGRLLSQLAQVAERGGVAKHRAKRADQRFRPEVHGEARRGQREHQSTRTAFFAGTSQMCRAHGARLNVNDRDVAGVRGNLRLHCLTVADVPGGPPNEALRAQG